MAHWNLQQHVHTLSCSTSNQLWAEHFQVSYFSGGVSSDGWWLDRSSEDLPDRGVVLTNIKTTHCHRNI